MKTTKPEFDWHNKHDVIDVGCRGTRVYSGMPARLKYYKGAMKYCRHWEEDCRHARCCRAPADADKVRPNCRKAKTCRYSVDYYNRFWGKMRDALFATCDQNGITDEWKRKYLDMLDSPWGVGVMWPPMHADLAQVRKASRGPRKGGSAADKAVNEAVSLCRCVCDCSFACKYGERGFFYGSVEDFEKGWEHNWGNIGTPRCDECPVGHTLHALGAYAKDDILQAYHDKQARVLAYEGFKWLYDKALAKRDVLGEPMVDQDRLMARDKTVVEGVCAYLRLCCANKADSIEGIRCTDKGACRQCPVARLLVLFGDCTHEEAAVLCESRKTLTGRQRKALVKAAAKVGIDDYANSDRWPN